MALAAVEGKPWPDDRRTAPQRRHDALAELARRHHRLVHEGGWRLEREPDGRLTAIPP